MNAIILLSNNNLSNASGYIAGAVISVFILGYLLYTLIKPEKI